MKLNCIMLVEDDETVVFYNRFLLEQMDAAEQVVVAENGKQALEYLERCGQDDEYRCPDVIFLDINMPVMNGFEFLEVYEQLPSTDGRIPVIMLTTSDHPEDVQRASRFASITEYLNKPLLREALSRIIAKYT